MGTVIVVAAGAILLLFSLLNHLKPKKLLISDGSITYEGKKEDKNFSVKLSEIKQVDVNGILDSRPGLKITSVDEIYNCDFGKKYNQMIYDKIRNKIKP